ncbi:hypothetical protein KR084_002871, partial [Drosophila pseudotakahashii]
MESSKTLLDLPLEVLDLIFEQLSRSHKLRLADSHPILHEAFLYHVRDLFKTIDFSELPSKDLFIIWRLCGSNVLDIDTGEKSVENLTLILQLIENHCNKLESFQTNVAKDTVNAICSLLLKSENLISVALKFYDEFDECDPECAIHVLKQMPALRKLQIGFIPDLKIYLIQQFVALEELDLSASYVGDLHLNIFEICAPLKKLRCLRVSGCNVHGKFENDGLSYQVLEKLGVAHCEIEHELPFFPMLKSMEIRNTYGPNGRDLERSWTKHENTLEKATLLVDCFCDYWLLHLIRSCRKLRYLYLHPQSSEPISKSTMLLFIKTLKENGVTSEMPFKLEVLGNSR